MAFQKKSHVITVRFVMRKGTGNWPELNQLSTEERADLRRIATFLLDWDLELGDPLKDLVTNVELIYDGISPLQIGSKRHGLHIIGTTIEGYPSPIIRFEFSKKINADDFIKGVWMSQVCLQSKVKELAGSEPFYCEDHQGYTGIADTALIEKVQRYSHEACVTTGGETDIETLVAGLHLSNLID